MIATPTTKPHTGKDYLNLTLTATDKLERSPNQSLLPLTAKINDKDHLEIGGCDISALVKQFGSPLYILDEVTLRTACSQYRDGFKTHYPGESQVIYASKAWSCLAVVGVIASEKLGFDVVSGGELYTTEKALAQLGDSSQEIAEKIYFHGNNKSVEELKQAIEIGCTIIVDNWLELETLTQLGNSQSGSSIPILIRLTPGIECHTHEYIRTGHLDSKFGFDPNQLQAVFSYIAQQNVLDCRGLHAHIGSQIFERQPHQDLAGVLVEWLKIGSESGLNLRELNIGGGLGICYTEADDPPSIEEWVKAVSEAVIKACQRCEIPLPKLIAEPGRSLIGSACVTAYTVGSRKEIPQLRTYLAVDGGMSDNPRPITYQSLYRVVLGNRMSAEMTETVTIAGKHCESGDIVIKDAQLPQTHPGDILVIMGTGAYNYSMASNYNRLSRPAAVLVNNGEANLIVRRETYDDLIKQDCLPQRLLP
ncbi:MAG: diaminopimelate decarboxylase [Crocosphaera sp.]|nr:diaminopimelate decarboxylase [Crocosphaera sp.]